MDPGEVVQAGREEDDPATPRRRVVDGALDGRRVVLRAPGCPVSTRTGAQQRRATRANRGGGGGAAAATGGARGDTVPVAFYLSVRHVTGWGIIGSRRTHCGAVVHGAEVLDVDQRAGGAANAEHQRGHGQPPDNRHLGGGVPARERARRHTPAGALPAWRDDGLKYIVFKKRGVWRDERRRARPPPPPASSSGADN